MTTSAKTRRMPHDLGLRIGNTADLPDVLKQQLRKAKAPSVEEKILDVAHYLGGVCTSDELIVGLWRRHSVLTESRREFVQRLYRMTRKGALCSVPGKRGVWSLPNARLTGAQRPQRKDDE